MGGLVLELPVNCGNFDFNTRTTLFGAIWVAVYWLVRFFAHLFVLGIEVKMMAGRFYFGVNCFSLLYCFSF
jgi:hypothetical protein